MQHCRCLATPDLTRRLAGLRAQFVAGLPARADEVQAWMADESADAAVLMRLAHRLRGVAPTHGLAELGRVAAAAEDACRGAARGDVLAHAEALLGAIRAACIAPIEAVAVAPVVESTPQRPLEGWRVVAIDDDAMMRRLLGLTLVEMGGARAVVASSAQELEAALREEPADLVISDAMMPNESGPALLQRLTAAGLLGSARVVVLSAAAAIDVAARSGEIIDARWVWMNKPFRPPELVKALAALPEPSI